jgi:predicted metalloprotease with PDZ domain
LRGGGPSAHFFINQRRPIEQFRADWSAVHELSHLLLPYVASEDSWLSEGLASYYQYILLARAQAIPAASAWQSMHVSFMRGRRDEQGMTLAQATEHMYSNGNYMRVYWEGAALMLLADQRLRERSAGAVSLDVVLDRLQRCCLTPANGWRAAELLQRMDELAGSTVFSELYAGEARAQDFPDLSEAYRRLGLELDQDGKLSLSADAPSAAHRDAIMAPFAREAAGAGPNLK